jgi:hypothetical protein
MRQEESLPPATVDITIAPDGRVFVFGLSREVLQVVAGLNPHDQRLSDRLVRLRQIERGRVTAAGEDASHPT